MERVTTEFDNRRWNDFRLIGERFPYERVFVQKLYLAGFATDGIGPVNPNGLRFGEHAWKGEVRALGVVASSMC